MLPAGRVVFVHTEYQLTWSLLDFDSHHVATYAYVVSRYDDHVVSFAGVDYHPRNRFAGGVLS